MSNKSKIDHVVADMNVKLFKTEARPHPLFKGQTYQWWCDRYKIDAINGLVYSARSLMGKECKLRSVGSFNKNMGMLTLCVLMPDDSRQSVYIHDLIYFLDNNVDMTYLTVSHVDGNKLNNRVDNLEAEYGMSCVLHEDDGRFTVIYAFNDGKNKVVAEGFTSRGDAQNALSAMRHVANIGGVV